MPAEREDEICQKALELLSDLCAKGEVQDVNCLDFIYYFRDLARPGYADAGQAPQSQSQSQSQSHFCLSKNLYKACVMRERLLGWLNTNTDF